MGRAPAASEMSAAYSRLHGNLEPGQNYGMRRASLGSVANFASLDDNTCQTFLEGTPMPGLGLILLIIVIMMLLGTVPTWPHSRNWGYGPSGGLGLILIIILVLLLLRVI